MSLSSGNQSNKLDNQCWRSTRNNGRRARRKAEARSFASQYQVGPSVEEICPTVKEGFGNIFYDEGLENAMQLTVIFVLLGKPVDVLTEQYQFHSESNTDNEKVTLEEKRVGPNAETGRSFRSQELWEM